MIRYTPYGSLSLPARIVADIISMETKCQESVRTREFVWNRKEDRNPTSFASDLSAPLDEDCTVQLQLVQRGFPKEFLTCIFLAPETIESARKRDLSAINMNMLQERSTVGHNREISLQRSSRPTWCLPSSEIHHSGEPGLSLFSSFWPSSTQSHKLSRLISPPKLRNPTLSSRYSLINWQSQGPSYTVPSKSTTPYSTLQLYSQTRAHGVCGRLWPPI